ncbi:HAD family hydrolase [Hyphomonas sp. NPDC076900]|uniref:HAD family hydrolase n=1 Tax=unclassified Hyphomonas TaxID=2630699 RepID=UPI003D08CF0F
MNFSALIFDCDGVLVDSEAIAIQAERELLAGWGLDYDFQAFVSRFVGLHNRDFYAALASDAEALGLALPEGFGPALQANNWKRYETELTAIEGVASVTEAFGGALAVASSSEADKLVRKLQIAGLHDLFVPHIYSSDLVTHGKPAPDLFLLTADKLNAAPEACLVIEDSINGIKAARAAGMTAWGFTGGGHADAGLAQRLAEAGAHGVFSSHREIASALSAR